jgi:potassium-transporting ATPase KdpC subunit
MIAYFKPALILFLLMTLLTGIVYPLLVTGLAQLLFPEQANGSLVGDEQGRPIASTLIGQAFQDPSNFWSRPSATSLYPYNASASGGSNLGPSNPELTNAVHNRIEKLLASDSSARMPVPVDLVTASASGLDPHITPAAAAYQIHRVAKQRQLPEHEIQKLVDQFTEQRLWGFLGEPRVNVVLLNSALNRLSTQSETK